MFSIHANVCVAFKKTLLARQQEIMTDQVSIIGK